jgi:hypothetical protein
MTPIVTLLTFGFAENGKNLRLHAAKARAAAAGISGI